MAKKRKQRTNPYYRDTGAECCGFYACVDTMTCSSMLIFMFVSVGSVLGGYFM